MSFSRLLRLASAAAFVAIAAACSDDATGPRPPAHGSYRMALAGDYAARHDGAAAFGVDGPLGEQFFAVLLGTEESDMANVVMFRPGTARLEVGTHEIANTVDQVPDAVGSIEVLLGIGNASSSTVGFFDGKSGTVTVTRSTDETLEGTFSVVAEGLLERDGGTAEPATVQVSGAFSAEPAEAPGMARRIRTSDVRVRPLGR